MLRSRFNLDVRTRSLVESIDRAAKAVHVRDIVSGREYDDHPQVDVDAVLAAPIGERIFLLDVRTPQEFASGHIPVAVHIMVAEGWWF